MKVRTLRFRSLGVRGDPRREFPRNVMDIYRETKSTTKMLCSQHLSYKFDNFGFCSLRPKTLHCNWSGTKENPSGSTMTHRPVSLFVLRHGEREDEALHNKFIEEAKQRLNRSGISAHHEVIQNLVNARVHQLSPPVDTLDPLLTVDGHAQAQDSWAALADAICGHKVAVFTSPLRRAIGTAMMVGGAVSSTNIKWSRPDSTTSRKSEIAITVLNELGNFASAVYRRGGVEAFLPSASMRCADTKHNDGSPESPLVRSLLEMPSHRVIPVGKYTIPVRFWGEASSPKSVHNHAAFVPISQSFIPSAKAYDTTQASVMKYPQKPGNTKKGVVVPKDPIGAIEDAVRITVARGCDVCIVVAHREAIHDMAERCGAFFRVKTPYCCIGSFGAVVEEGNDVRFSFSEVWSAGHDTKLRIPSPPPAAKNHTGFIVHQGEQMVRLCTIALLNLREGSLGTQIWLVPTKWNKFCHQNHIRWQKIYTMEFSVLNNAQGTWNDFLLRQPQEEVLVGETWWKRDDGSQHLLVLFINPQEGSRSMRAYIPK